MARFPCLLLIFPAILAAQDAGSVEGNVVNSLTHEPVKRAMVRLEGQNADGISALTDEAGKFQLAPFKPGNYLLFASAQGYPLKLLQGVNVVAGQKITGISLSLKPGGIISGKVLDADGDPMPNLTVHALVYTYAGGVRKLVTASVATTNDRGEYRLFNLLPRRYYLACGSPQGKPSPRGRIHHQEPDLDYAPTYYPSASDSAGAAPVIVPAGAEVGGIDIQRRKVPMLHVRGKVTGLATTRGAAVAVGSCEADDLSGFISINGGPPISLDSQRLAEPAAAEIQRDGSFDVSHVPPGTHCVNLQPGDSGGQPHFARQTVTLSDKDMEHVDLAITPPLELRGSLLVDGTLSTTPQNLTLFMAPEGLGLGFVNQQVNLNDSFVASGLYPVSYNVGMQLPGSLYVKSIRLGSQESSDTRIQMHSGAEPMTIVIATDAGQVSGTVKSASGDPVAGMVAIVPAAAPFRFGDARNGNSDEKGNFTVTGVPPGDYQVFAVEELDMSSIASPDYRKALQAKIANVSVHPNGSATAELTLITAEEAYAALEKVQ